MINEIPIPTEAEWQVMEVVWSGSEGITSSDIVKTIQQVKDISKTTIRVLVKRLVEKGLLDYVVDAHDSRVFHYRALYTREECQKAKSKDFVECYFQGNRSDAIAALVGKENLSRDQIRNLESILDPLKGKQEGV